MQPESDAVVSNDMELVTFTVAGQKFCLEITQIREIRRWSPVTILPHAPPEVLGVMNLRGAVIPIYDLSRRFGLGKAEASERSVVIVSAVNDKPVGLLVESVSEIVSIAASSIQETPDVKSDETRECIQGVISLENEMARVINLTAVIERSQEVAA